MAAVQVSRPQLYPIEYLDSNPFQPRFTIDEQMLAPLVESINRFGFWGHLNARPNPAAPAGRLQLVFGHRRLAAARAAGLRQVPVAVQEESDEAMAAQSFIENHTQLKLTPWEEAQHFQRLQQQFGYSVRDLARELGASKGYVQNRLDLLRIPPDSPIRPPLEQGKIGVAMARELHALALTLSPAELAALTTDAVNGRLTARDLAERSKEHAATKLAPVPEMDAPNNQPARAITTSAETADSDAESVLPGPPSLGRFTELLNTPRRRSQAAPKDDDFIVDYEEDSRELFARGIYTPDGLDLRFESDGIRDAHHVIHELKQSVRRCENLLPGADFRHLSAMMHDELYELRERYESIFAQMTEAIDPDDE